jgi:hypothetical protein
VIRVQGRLPTLALLIAASAGTLLLATPPQSPAGAPARPPAPAPVAAPPPAAESAPSVTTPAAPVAIVSPSPDAYVSGTTLLRAAIDPSLTPQTVTFFVDGRQFCNLTEAPFDCEWDAGSTISAHLIRLVVVPASGERLVKTMRTKGIGYADKVNVEAIQVTVTVSDDSGRFVGGIPRPAFHVTEDGKPQPITYFASEDVPLELIVAVDISGSMTTSMPKLKTAVKDFLLAVPAKDQVTLLGFNDSVFGRSIAWRRGVPPRSTTSSCGRWTCSAARLAARRWWCSPTARTRGAMCRSTMWSASCRRAT